MNGDLACGDFFALAGAHHDGGDHDCDRERDRAAGGRCCFRGGRAPRRWAVGFANIAQTIPSLALFGFLVPLPLIGGIGRRTAIVALCLYALLPILRNTLLGITGVDASVRESAVAMGMTQRQILWQVELPLAAPSIVAGLRLATVATIGTATIAAAIGGGGLGVFIFRGISMVDTPTVLAGALPAAAMALVADGGAGMDRTKNLACLTAALALAFAGCAPKPAHCGGLQEFHGAGAAGGDSGAAHRAAAAHCRWGASSTWAARCWRTRR